MLWAGERVCRSVDANQQKDTCPNLISAGLYIRIIQIRPVNKQILGCKT